MSTSKSAQICLLEALANPKFKENRTQHINQK